MAEGRIASGTAIESNAGAVTDDCMDAGDRAMQEQLPRHEEKHFLILKILKL
ncbi:hypothetical protein [Methylobacter sp. S3L5C]|uniref:hypothetical protein n=1 Tax=Methylobacter sp. S3L5C TaxID=2839024 RepID=UPI001FAB8DF7|nr:hypothetical protein [Methylobacter sp. S3L5C]UOA10243.1 hypothetical protein KKZ03_08430 [Methylobacter sp. S3L5C]